MAWSARGEMDKTGEESGPPGCHPVNVREEIGDIDKVSPQNDRVVQASTCEILHGGTGTPKTSASWIVRRQ